MNAKIISVILFFSISIGCYIHLAWFCDRENFGELIVVYGTCFFVYLIQLFYFGISFYQLLLAGLFFRLIFIFSIPTLSDDYNRFIWDARQMAEGTNPYEQKPTEAGVDNAPEFYLMKELNSPNYYSVYPPLQQVFFLPSGLTDKLGASVILLHFIILIGEILLFIFLIKSLQSQFISLVSVSWIWLNPLWIIEVNGNLHFEGWMMTFIAIGIYYLFKQKFWIASVFMGLSASLKIIPIIVLPAVKKWLGFNKAFFISLLAGIVFVISISWIFISAQQDHFFESIDLYYHKFEFNASFYFLLREIGFYFGDTHPIVYSGYILMPIFAFIYCFIIFRNDNSTPKHFFSSTAFILFSYYLLSTTVHPWYILTILFFSVLAGKWYGIVWSGLVFLSYSAYSNNENLYYSMITIEYFLLFVFMYLEFRTNKIKTLPVIE
jgi:alpha-1,6-mannosyltransferase